MKTRKSIDRILFDSFLCVTFLVLTFLSMQYQPLARELPLPVALFGIVLSLVLVLTELFPNHFQKMKKGNGKSDEESRNHDQTAWVNIGRITIWVIIFIVAIQFTNYLAATAGFVFLVAWLEGHLSIRKSIVLAISATAFFYVLFDLFLSVTF